MPTPSQVPVMWTIAAATVILLVCGFFAVNNVKNAIPEIPEIPNIPTAEEVAVAISSRITVPTAQEIVDLVDIPDTILSLRTELKSDAINVCDEEFDMDDIEDLYGDDDEVTLIREYVDDRHFTNINLGIDSEDDREITVHRVYKVEVEPDLDDDFKDKIYVRCEVISDDGELEVDSIQYHL